MSIWYFSFLAFITLIINPLNCLLMGFKKKFSVALTSSVLNLKGELVAYKRTPRTYVLKRSEKYVLPKTSYEVDVENLLPQFGISGVVTSEDMHKHHLSPGKDGRMYLCCFDLPERKLVPTIRLWLAHQVLNEKFGLDIVSLGSEFAGEGEFFVMARALKKEDASLSIIDVVLRICEAVIVIELI